MRRGTPVAALARLGALAGLAGCVSLARTEPTRAHYVLGADAFPSEAASPDVTFDLAVGLRRVNLASYLNSPFIVLRRGPNQVEFAEFHRWGEPVEAGISRVMADALAGRGFREVAAPPWAASARYDYVVQLDVVRFEGLAPDDPASTEGSVLVVATWEILRAPTGEPVAGGSTDHQRPGWTVGDYPGLVTLLDEALDVVADDIAAALAGLPPIARDPGSP